ncbi:hypothetical protein C8Q77DRAFT_688128 [Trametes polyzona]|nr:hypothetical protein C8Q77DRAFT_688128 [Trametes polyzona]
MVIVLRGRFPCLGVRARSPTASGKLFTSAPTVKGYEAGGPSAARKLARGASLFPHAVGSSSLPFCRWVLCGATLRFHRGRRSTSWIAIQPCSSVQRMLELLSGCPRPLEIRLIEMETVSRRRPLWALSFKTIAPDPAPRAPGIRQIWASSFAFGRKCMQRPGLMSQTLRSQPRRLRAVSLVRPYGCPAKTRLSVWGATTRIMRRQPV